MSKQKSPFNKQKQESLSGVDLSRKGSIDEPILDLVKLINEQQDFFTTSSCSGRICVFEDNPETEKKKMGCRWLYTTHGICQLVDVIKALGDSIGNALFKFEPFVLHVQCRSTSDGQFMHEAAISSGYRNSGLSISRKGKVISAVRSTHSLEVPLTVNGNLLVSEEYIQHLVTLANGKMEENIYRINRFHVTLMEKIKTYTAEEDKVICRRKNIDKKCHRTKAHAQKEPNRSSETFNVSDKDCDNDFLEVTNFAMFAEEDY